MQKNGLFYLFYFLKYLSFKLWPLAIHHPLYIHIMKSILYYHIIVKYFQKLHLIYVFFKL